MLITTTPRLKLMKFDDGDSSFLQKLMNTPKWIEFIGDRGISSEAAAKNYIAKNIISGYMKNGFGTYKIIVKATDTPIGTCGILQRDFLELPDLGFALLPDFERHGYAFEASQAVLRYAKNNLGLKRVLAFTNPKNSASKRLLVKLGFQDHKMIKRHNGQLAVLKKDL